MCNKWIFFIIFGAAVFSTQNLWHTHEYCLCNKWTKQSIQIRWARFRLFIPSGNKFDQCEYPNMVFFHMKRLLVLFAFRFRSLDHKNKGMWLKWKRNYQIWDIFRLAYSNKPIWRRHLIDTFCYFKIIANHRLAINAWYRIKWKDIIQNVKIIVVWNAINKSSRLRIDTKLGVSFAFFFSFVFAHMPHTWTKKKKKQRWNALCSRWPCRIYENAK